VPSRRIAVRFTVPGFHQWPDAPAERFYLSSTHRHLWHAEVTITVEHNDREVEFHDLLDHARTALEPNADNGWRSTEDLATFIAAVVRQRWPARHVMVSLYEDGECGAILAWGPDEPVELEVRER